ncbi:NUDIX domain-containing protein [Rhodococcoides fascians A21d2]|uniref:NUDIX domain-containing protein n=1 Tax=Nocardiaceae TaxID=85025 RepID=UPI0006910D88|nr:MULTISPECIES: NUDIX domain-containing protein [Rhodococcus]OZC51171.1 hypothetical protein CH286_06560 [Rhodococcus sp. WWJCD1]QIH99266.1 NUDIX domain-containing protein [Rhodococcus fascians A21d2]
MATEKFSSPIRVGLAERHLWVEPQGRRAAVAFPVIDHPTWGLCTAATVRASVNGHNGQRMTHAGDVVLFGGAIEAGETGAMAALRELCEESETLDHLDDPSYAVRERLGAWTTESGIEVEGFLVELPPEFVDVARPDPREVARIGFLRLAELLDESPSLVYHRVDARDTQTDLDVTDLHFESPTIDLVEVTSGDTWTLWGVAGQMTALARDHLLRTST